MAKPATRGTRANVPSGTARNSFGRTVAAKLLDLLAARLTDGEGEQADPLLVGDGGTFCRAARFRPNHTPRRPEIVDLRRSCGA